MTRIVSGIRATVSHLVAPWPRSTMVVGVAMALVAAFQALAVLGHVSPVSDGQLAGPDGYMYLLRAEALSAGADWRNTVVPATNAPYGEATHWAHQYDVWLLAGAWVGSFFTDPTTALWTWSILASPTLLGLAMPLWWWGTRGTLAPGEYLVSVVLLVSIPITHQPFLVGRPDHHALLGAYFLIQVGACSRRVALQDDRPRVAVVAAVASGLAAWMSVEGIIALAMTMLIFVGAWARDGRGRGQVHALLIATVAVLAAGLWLERGPAALQPRYNQLSVVDVLPVALATGLSGMLALVQHQPPITRLVTASLMLGVAPLLLTLAAFPRLALGPFADFDPEIVANHTMHVAEMLPLGWGNSAQFVALGVALFAGISGIALGARRGDSWRPVVVPAIVVALYLPSSLLQVRWGCYLGIGLIVLCARAVERVLAGPDAPLGSRLARASLGAGFVVGPLVGQLGWAYLLATTSHASKAAPNCPYHVLAERILAVEGDRGAILWSLPGMGPRFAWETGMRVVGAPYANTEAIGDTTAFFTSVGGRDTIAKRIVLARGVGWVAVCQGAPEGRLFGGRDPQSMLSRLSRGESPDWLDETEIEGLGDIRLFRVVVPPAR